MLKASNEELRADVIAELDAEPMIDAARIGVAVEDGVLTLTGSVPSLTQKWAAEEAAKRVKGVSAVVQRMEVDLPATHRRNDVDIAHAVADAFYWDTSVPETVQATVQNGFVTLSGEVVWNYQREEAESVARRVAGVTGVNNSIMLKPAVVSQDVRGEMQRMFHRAAQLDANNITIAIDGGKVTLSGSVRSWFERNEATRAAWSVRGVTAVDNQITVI